MNDAYLEAERHKADTSSQSDLSDRVDRELVSMTNSSIGPQSDQFYQFSSPKEVDEAIRKRNRDEARFDEEILHLGYTRKKFEVYKKKLEKKKGHTIDDETLLRLLHKEAKEKKSYFFRKKH